MFSLQSLIRKHGYPDAIVDHWGDSNFQYAVWGFESIFVCFENKYTINGKSYFGSPLDAWQAWIDNCKLNSTFISAVGFISYDFKNILFPHIQFKKQNTSVPLIWFGKPKIVREFTNDINSDYIGHKNILNQIKDIPNTKIYAQDINKIKYYLERGDVYQINYTHPKVFTNSNNPCDTYMAIRNKAKPLNGYYINAGKQHILSFSPERFFRTHHGIIESFPMKGTRPRYSNKFQDNLSAKELANSNKDKAEHLMIVDLLRNDIGKVCKFGTVKVEDLYKVNSFETVHQMVSRVFGSLKSNASESDIIRGLFPGGSITGAPKERAMLIIDELESSPRDIYTGGIGYILSNGDMDFNIAILTMTIENEQVTYPVGGGIVWDSDPVEEWKEAHIKGAILHQFIQKQEVECV